MAKAETTVRTVKTDRMAISRVSQETTEISSIEAAKGNAKGKKLFRNGKIYIGDYTIAGLRVL